MARRGRYQNRVGELEAKQFQGRIHLAWTDGGFRYQLYPIERLAITPQGKFSLHTVSGVVIGISRQFRICHRLEIERSD